MYNLTWFSEVTTFDLAASRGILLLAFLIIFDNSLQNLLCHILIFMIAIFIDVYYYYGVKTHCKTIFDRFKFSYSCQSKLHSNLSSFKMLSFVILFPGFFLYCCMFYSIWNGEFVEFIQWRVVFIKVCSETVQRYVTVSLTHFYRSVQEELITDQ